MTEVIQILDPRGEPGTTKLRLAPRVRDLNGKVIGLLDNDWWSFGVALERMQELLKANWQVADLIRAGRKHGLPPPELLQDLSARCDVVINGLGN